ncbi:MAG: hypothetical protein Q9226_008221, partial [Calogaya cf. arnoldii]
SLIRDGNKNKCYGNRGYHTGPTEWYDCRECKALNDFLAAPDRSEWRYKAAEPTRKHLDRRLNNLDCSSFTDKSQGTPYTIVIRKTDKIYRDALNRWERRCVEAKSEVEGIGHKKLRTFLGEQYESIMEQLSGVTNGTTLSTCRQPLASLAVSAQNNKRARDGVEDGPTEKRARQSEANKHSIRGPRDILEDYHGPPTSSSQHYTEPEQLRTAALPSLSFRLGKRDGGRYPCNSSSMQHLCRIGNVNSFLGRDYATERQAAFALELRSTQVLAPRPLEMSSMASSKLCDLRSLMKQAAQTRIDCRDVCGSKARIVYSATNLFGVLRRLQQEATMARSSLNTSNSTCNESLTALCSEITSLLKETSDFLLAYKTLGYYEVKILGSWEFGSFTEAQKSIIAHFDSEIMRLTYTASRSLITASAGSLGELGEQLDYGTGTPLSPILNDLTARLMANGDLRLSMLMKGSENEDILWEALQYELLGMSLDKACLHRHKKVVLRYVGALERRSGFSGSSGTPIDSGTKTGEPTTFGPGVVDDLLADFLEEEEQPSKEHALRSQLRDAYRILYEDYEPQYELTVFFEAGQDKQDSKLVAGLIHDIENRVVMKLDNLELGQDASLRNLRKMIINKAQKMLDDLEKIKGK